MAKMLKIRMGMGVADDPSALQPSLNDCLDAMLQQADALMADVLQNLQLGASAASGQRRIASLQSPPVRAAVTHLNDELENVTITFRGELTRLVYEGGGKEQTQTELLRFEDLQLFEDEQLDQSIEVARAQQEVASAVDDSLPALDALISTMLGWRTIQPGLNPLRPDVFVRALQYALSEHVPDPAVREKLITPTAGLMGVTLRRMYRELTDWLRSTGVEPAVPIGGRVHKGSGASGVSVIDSVAKTLLTLDRLRSLLAGDFDQPRRPDFLHTVPASMHMLQDMNQVDKLVNRLEQRAKPAPTPSEPVDMLAESPARKPENTPKIGQQLGKEVVRLMFDNLGQDTRLVPAFKRQLKAMEPAVLRLTEHDSRFFSDRNHPARQLLDRLTQRSLAFGSEHDEGFVRFMTSVEEAARWLESKVVDVDTFGELMDHLQEQWSAQDQKSKQKREDAARALLHAEQRNLLAQKLASEFEQIVAGLDVADFIRDFLKGSWAQVVAEAQLSCEDGSPDPFGYRALVDDLVWSVQKTSAQRGRARRLVQMIPGLLQRLRDGLQGIGYPPELTQRFFDNLITLHRAAVREGRDAGLEAAAEKAWTEESQFPDSGHDEVQMWLDQNEVHDSGYVGEQDMDLDFVASPLAGEKEQAKAAAPLPPPPAVPAPPPFEHPDFKDMELEVVEAAPPRDLGYESRMDPAAAAEAEAQGLVPPSAPEPEAERAAPAAPAQPLRVEELRVGAWVEIHIKGAWVRAQLTWCSPHATLFMFTSHLGDAHSMSRRTLDKLRIAGQMRVIADRPVVDEALDQVAQAALKNTMDGR